MSQTNFFALFILSEQNLKKTMTKVDHQNVSQGCD